MKLLFTLILLFGSTQYINNDISRKVISDDDYNYTFFVSSKTTSNYENLKQYYWYKSGKIHSSFGGGDGQILHGQYNKTYRKNGVAEQGEFHYGLKDDTWKNWYENGNIKKIANWQKGFLSGPYKEFTESGELLVSGKYKYNKKHGRWISHQAKDTIYFKRGEKVIKEEVEEEKDDKSEKQSFVNKTKNFFKDIFKKKTPEEKEKAKKEKELRKQKKEIEKKRKELAKKKEASKKNTSKKQ